MNIGDIIDENQKGATNVCPTAMVNVSEETHPISKSGFSLVARIHFLATRSTIKTTELGLKYLEI